MERWRQSRHAPDSRNNWRREIVPVAVMVGLWVALFVNNVGALPPDKVGFDVEDHLSYIRYIQENKSLPLAGEGWEMYQPPLYYLLSAGALSLLSLSVSQLDGILMLRIMGLVCGVAHVALVWAAMRLLFPKDAAKQLCGLLLAACLAPVLYLSQYVSNEALAATLASACLYLCLRLLKQDRISLKACAGLGVCLGAALLTKTTNLLLVPVVFGALVWRWFEKPEDSRSRWTLRMGMVFGLVAIVCGWHYARVWLHYGNPLIGNWDSKSIGYVWWQDDGYRTSAYYLQFGEALRHPWYAGFKSFGDGVYSTLWGDGLLGGVLKFSFAPPWNYDLMAIGYWLSVLPTLAVLVGAILALFKFVRQPSAQWLLLLGFGFLVAVALVYMSLVVPCGGQSKAFYALPALVPLCAAGAWGLDFLAGRKRYWRWILCVFFGVWAINSYASFWVLRSSVSYALIRGEALTRAHQFAEASDFLKARLNFHPEATDLRLLLMLVLFSTGDLDEAERQVQIAARQDPHNGQVRVWEADICTRRQQFDRATVAARQSVELAPGNGPAYEQLANLLINQERYREAARIARQGVGVAAFNAGLRMALGSALLFLNQEGEALTQFQYACRLNLQSADRLNNLAWKLSTDEDVAQRNGAVAVKLAELACAVTEYRKAACINTLAATYAEAGRFEEAVRTAEQARASAIASGQAALAAKSQNMIDVFRSGRPYREKNSR